MATTLGLPAVPAPLEVKETDKRDKGTADDWVPRLPSLIRLTGRHPFNSEPPTKDLVDAGFITPVAMHYVR
jgi:nitrate reductase (NAD(P)H)